ncbi:MAG: hypothetical protein ABI766_12455 [Gemmatimonadales bacterium]
MGDKSLDQYLNAHLAGSVGALELIDALERKAPGASQEAFMRGLRSDIESSQATLRAIMQQVGAEENRLEQAAAWLGEKFARARLAATASGQPVPGWMEGLEMLALGAVAPTHPSLAAFEFASLNRSAVELFAKVDRERIAAAVAAFTPGA